MKPALVEHACAAGARGVTGRCALALLKDSQSPNTARTSRYRLITQYPVRSSRKTGSASRSRA